jgi:hypothetical protein
MNDLQIGEPFLLFMEEIAPGVRGYTQEVDGELWVPVIHAERPGNGAVGRFLDRLPTDRTIVVPTVLSARLAGMLVRRGFRVEYRLCSMDGQEEGLETFVRRAKEERR